MCGEQFEVSVKWNELDAETTQENADRQKVKADTYAVLAQTGAIDGQDIRDKLGEDPESGFNGLSGPAPDQDDDGKFTDSHKASLKHYTGGRYKPINWHLR
jgi:hypothetical protein